MTNGHPMSRIDEFLLEFAQVLSINKQVQRRDASGILGVRVQILHVADGVSKNRADLEMFMRYSWDRGLTGESIPVVSLLAESTLAS